MRTVQVGDALHLVRRPVEVDPIASYEEIGIRSFGRGFFPKPPILGSELGSKRMFEINEGDLVLNIVFAWEGAVALAGPREHKKCASHRFPTYVADPEVCDPRYLHYFFMTPRGLAALGQASPGSAGRNRTLNLRALEAVQVELPPVGEQQRIADRVEALVERIEVARKLRLTATGGLLTTVAGTGAAAGGTCCAGCSANHARQQNENAQHTRVQWRRIARSLRTWKSAQPSSPLTCLSPCSTQVRSPYRRTTSARSAGANAAARRRLGWGRLVTRYQVVSFGSLAGSVVATTSRSRRSGPQPAAGSRASAAHQVWVCPSRNRRVSLVQSPGRSGLSQASSAAASRGVWVWSAGAQTPLRGLTAST